jgi:predicted dienelactone hydrolase
MGNMIASDLVLIAALAVCVVAWWMRRAAARTIWLASAAVVGLIASGYGVMDDRWQASAGLIVSLVFIVALLIWKARRAPRRDRVPFVSGTLLALLAVAAVLPLYLFPVTDLPRPGGPYPVGVKDFELTDRSRLGVWRAAEDEPRRLLIRVWYPAGSVAGLKRRHYFDPIETTHTARSFGELFRFPPLLTYLKHVRTNSYVDAPLLAGANNLPTVIYSHGYTMFLSQNTALMEELASHGYVVYSIQHTFDSATTVFPDGDIAPIDPQLIEQSLARQGELPEAMLEGYTSRQFDDRLAGQLRYAREIIESNERIIQSTAIWVADRLFVHDQLQQRAVPGDVVDIVNASKLDRVGEIGMSFGGSTTGAICIIDTRCAAGVNLDGGDFHYIAFDADMPRPFLMFHSDIASLYRLVNVEPAGFERSPNDFSYERLQHAGELRDIHRLQLRGAAHLGLSDLSLFIRSPVRDVILGTAPAEVLIGAQNDFVRGFFDKHVRGVANDFPKAEFRKYGGWALPYDNKPVRDWWLSKPQAERQSLQAQIDDLKRLVSLPRPAPSTSTAE